MSVAHRLETAGITMNVRIEGSGPPLLFLGGSNFDLSIRAPVFDSALTDHFSVACADPRGLGLTDAPDGDWAMQDYACDALNLLNALEWAGADVLGESFGAMTAMHLAALAPDRVKRLALCAGSPGGAGGSSYPIQQFQDIPDPALRARAALQIMDSRFLHRPQDEVDVMTKARVASEATFLASHDNALNYPRLLEARAAHDAWALLPTIKAPTLVFAGRYDQQAPLDRAQNIVGAMPNAALHVVEGGHSICFGTSDPVEIMLQSWI